MALNRRTFLSGMMAVSLPLLNGCDQKSPGTGSQLPKSPSPEAINQAGLQGLKPLIDQNLAGIVKKAPLANIYPGTSHPEWAAADNHSIRAAYMKAISLDYEAGDIVSVDNWQLSRSEAWLHRQF
jgi:hypothetical protein